MEKGSFAKDIFLLSILLLSISCTSKTIESPLVIPFEILASGQYSGLTEKTNQLIGSQNELDAAWEKIYSIQIPVPPVDFSQHSLILTARGEQRTSGYDVKATKIEASAKEVIVYLNLTSPPKNGVLLPVLTQPFILIKTTKINKPVRFVETGADE